MYTWSQVSILRVNKLHTDGHLPTKGQDTLELPTKKVSLHCEGTRNLKAWMIVSCFDLLMLQILSPPLPKRYFQVSSKILFTVLTREADIHVLEIVGLTSGGQKPLLPETQLVTHQHT